MTTATPTTKQRRTLSGLVVSTGMQKTIVVRVDRMKMHPKYSKRYRVSKKYHVHDETGTAKVGDTVEFTESRPMSKLKRWRRIAVPK